MSTFSRVTAALVVLVLTYPGHAGQANSYAAIDRHALKAPPEAEASLGKLASYLAGPCKTEKDKARAAYRWITDRIAYDVPGLLSGNLGDPAPAAVLKSRKTFCEGFADLFVDLCTRMGVKSAKVSGYAKIVGYKPGDHFTATNHAWNAVQLDGKWYLVDTVMGAGGLKGREFDKNFSEYPFLVDPEALLFTHCPRDAKWQLIDPPLTLEQFEKLPEVNRRLFELGVPVGRVKAVMAEKGFREFVQAYPTPGFTARIVAAPLTKYLKAGQAYRFEFQSKECTDMLVLNEGKVTPLRKEGTTFRGTVTVQRGQLLVGGTAASAKGAKQRQYSFVLQYVVE